MNYRNFLDLTFHFLQRCAPKMLRMIFCKLATILLQNAVILVLAFQLDVLISHVYSHSIHFENFGNIYDKASVEFENR
jgi:hypothetical protein